MRLAVQGALLLTLLLSLPSALAVRSAVVEAEAQIAVVSTGSALLSLTPGEGTGNAAGTAHYRNSSTADSLVLDFTRGIGGGGGYGFPPNGLAYHDRFRYRGLFLVTNRSDDPLCISVYVPGGGVPDLAGIYLRPVGDSGTGTATAGGGGVPSLCATLPSGSSFEVDFWWEIASASDRAESFTIRVEGIR